MQGPTLFLYDKYPGGLGYAQRAYHLIEEVMRDALRLIQGCACDDGCPSCVGSPLQPQYQQDPDLELKGRIPDKEAALVLLHALLELPDYVPRVPLSPAAARRAQALLAAAAAAAAGAPGAPGGSEGPRAEGERSARRRREPSRGGATPGPAGSAGEAPLPERAVVRLPDDLRRKLEEQLARVESTARRHRGRTRQPGDQP